jgi:uncharacterized membrane protein
MRAELRRLPLVLAIAAVALQIAYPLTHGSTRDHITIAIVLVFAAASASHAVLMRGMRAGGAIVALTLVGGFAVEVLGVHTGFPFGRYSYSSTLGPRLFGVPVVMGAAWTMLAWPAALVARRIASSFTARTLVGAWALASWDLFLDPQMVGDGHWRWHHPSPHLPGVATVPLTNYLGWLLPSLAISLVLQGFLRERLHEDGAPIALYLWTYVGSTLALLAYLDLEAAAMWGALGMGLIAIPLVLRLAR